MESCLHGAANLGRRNKGDVHDGRITRNRLGFSARVKARGVRGDSGESTMQLDTCHFGIHVHSIEEARAFYVDKLGFEILQEVAELGLIAVRAGNIRLTMIADISKIEAAACARVGGTIIFRTGDLDGTIATLTSLGIDVSVPVERPGFMRFVILHDPSGNPVQIAEYLRDPLVAV
jgi:catechol 2,3-dioxygenase-like lactoylglutathione lyase family enzyme